MADLGFRPPQFSEDLAWLPAWLQPQQAQEAYEHDKESQVSSKQDTCLHGTGNRGKSTSLLSTEDQKINSFQLVLTGEENTPACFSTPSANVPHFRLHLSPWSISQDKSDLVLSAVQLQSVSNLDLGGHQIENVCRRREVHQSEGECEPDVRNLHLAPIQKIVKDVGAKSTESNNTRMHHMDIDLRHLKAGDLEEAIKLSIAASEALVIHKMIEEGLGAEASLLKTVLELSLRVKQTRLQCLKDDFPCTNGRTDENDNLSDLDDFIMAEAFEDVGLRVSGHSDHLIEKSDFQPTQDTPALKNYSTHVQDGGDEAGNAGISTTAHLEKTLVIDVQLAEDIHLKTHRSELPERSPGNTDCSLHTFDETEHANLVLHGSIMGEVDEKDIIASQPEGALKTSPNAQKVWKDAENITHRVSDRYTSRWFGGWGKKVLDLPAVFPKVEARRRAAFIGETSSLSESMDLAPDENSVVQGQESRPDGPSQSSKYVGGSCDVAKDGQLFSQDIVRSSSQSLVDPLCSVVPCSITSEDAGAGLTWNQWEKEASNADCYVPSSEPVMENLQENLNMNIEHVCGYHQSKPTVPEEYSGAATRKQVTSLKAYSMLLPDNSPVSNGNIIHGSSQLLSECNDALLPVGNNILYNKSSSNWNSETFLPSKPASGIAAKGYAETTSIAKSRSHNETEIDGIEMPFECIKRKRLPAILDNQSHDHCQASEPLLNKLIGKSSVPALGTQTFAKFEKNSNFQNIQSEDSGHNKCEATPTPAQKRVRFADAEIQLQKCINQKARQSSHRNCSTVRTNKRSKRTCPPRQSQSHDEKRHTKGHASRYRKRLKLQGIEFLLTGFPSEKMKDIEDLIWKYGGVVLRDIPPPQSSRRKKSTGYIHKQLPVVLCTKKLQTTTFLYGCAVNAYILRVDWLFDSVKAGSIQACAKYMIVHNWALAKCSQIGKPIRLANHQYIFDGVGILLQGENSFCSKFEKVFKHGGGQVFKTLRGLVCSREAGRISVAAVVAQYEGQASRHLTYCASEKKIPVMSCSWLVESLHKGRLLPITKKNKSSLARSKTPEFANVESSQEI